jgi:hypothetical protein
MIGKTSFDLSISRNVFSATHALDVPDVAHFVKLDIATSIVDENGTVWNTGPNLAIVVKYE